MPAILRYFHASSEIVIATQAQKPEYIADIPITNQSAGFQWELKTTLGKANNLSIVISMV